MVACLSLLLDFDPISVVPNGGHFGGIVLANNAWRNEFNKRQRGNRSKNSNGSYTSHVKGNQYRLNSICFALRGIIWHFFFSVLSVKVKTHFLLHST